MRAFGEIVPADRTDALGGEADRLPDALVRDSDWAAMLVRSAVEAKLAAEGTARPAAELVHELVPSFFEVTVLGPLPVAEQRPSYHWVCPDCFELYRVQFGWSIEPPSASRSAESK